MRARNGDAVAGAENGDASCLLADYWDGVASDATDFAGFGAVAGSLFLGVAGDCWKESGAIGGTDKFDTEIPLAKSRNVRNSQCSLYKFMILRKIAENHELLFELSP